MKKRTTVLLTTLIVLFSFLVTACGGNSPQSAQPAGESTAEGKPAVGGSLVVGITGDPYNLATWLSNDMNSSMVMFLVIFSVFVMMTFPQRSII